MLARQLADFGLVHPAERKERAAELLLRKAEEKISLVLAAIGWPLKQPAAGDIAILNAGIVSGRYKIRANLPCNDVQLIELQMIVAQAARDGRAAREILRYEWPYDFALEAFFVIDHIIWNTDMLGHAARVVDIVERTASTFDSLRHAFVPG